ncbi:MAG: cytochrome c assembly protein, partial [Chitinophagaceae bacterium]
GNGLNQLLQNYWMVIHPPVLFLGFASTVIPFAYAIGGLWTKNYGDWTKPALPWALFSAAVLGTGVLMGAAWAYESLSFGGYWAWDPVENASMVPWLVLVAGIHTLLIYKHTGRSLRATHLFFILAFILVVYSTFLTRSGVLGDTSVHSFADLGMNFQLFMFIMVFLAPALWLFFTNLKRIPHIQKEEQVSSREFWMFIGSLVLFFSALVIIGKTSVPVVNKIFGTNIAPPAEVEYSYNSIIIWVAIIIGLLTAVVQYLKYKETASKFFLKRILLPIIISAAAIILILGFGNINYNKYGAGYLAAIWIALASSVFAVIANFSYIWLGVKGSLKLSGPSIAHLGFGLMLAGILISSSKKETLSYNTSGIFVNFGEKSNEKPGENLTLVKGQKMDMGKYWVTYEKDSMHPKKSQWYYSLKFENKNGKEIFTLKPNAFINYKGNEGLMANPDAKHYWDHDIFAYITSLPDPEKNKDTSSFNNLIKKTGDSIFYSRGYMILENVKTTDSLPTEIFGEDGKLYEARLNIFSKTGSVHTAFPKLAFAKGAFISVPDTITAESLVLQLNKVEGNTVEIGVKESGSVLQYLTLKAYKFPFINVLWLGALLMAAGFIISLVRRV